MSAVAIARQRAPQGAAGDRCRGAVNTARWVILVAVTGWSLSGWGQKLADPTRPPAAWLERQAKGGSGDAGTPEAPPRLQSLLVGGPRKYAIIDGQLVGVGDKFRDGRVLAVEATQVVLRTAQGTQTLKLFPDVEKRVAKPAPAGVERRSKLSPTADRGVVIKETK